MPLPLLKHNIIMSTQMESFVKKPRLKRRQLCEGKVYLIDRRVIWLKHIAWTGTFANLYGPTVFLDMRGSYYERGVIILPSEEPFVIHELDDTARDFLLTMSESLDHLNNITNLN